MIEVRPAEADAETLRLFSDYSLGLTETLHFPEGCEIRRCMIVLADFAAMLIRSKRRAGIRCHQGPRVPARMVRSAPIL
jgi:hypothetical protein